MKIIGIIGTRKRDSSEAYKKVKQKFLELYKDGDWICSGGCEKGADRFALIIAKEEGIPLLLFHPAYKKFKKSAPFIRNISIAKHCDIIIACIIHPESKIEDILQRKGGTEHTLKEFVKVNLISNIYLV